MTELIKGAYKGKCNRSSCLKVPAVYYNHSTREHYCAKCAHDINLANHREAMDIWGHDICTLVEGTTEEDMNPFSNDYKPLPGKRSPKPKKK